MNVAKNFNHEFTQRGGASTTPSPPSDGGEGRGEEVPE